MRKVFYGDLTKQAIVILLIFTARLRISRSSEIGQNCSCLKGGQKVVLYQKLIGQTIHPMSLNRPEKY
jgi:hypothetical protein